MQKMIFHPNSINFFVIFSSVLWITPTYTATSLFKQLEQSEHQLENYFHFSRDHDGLNFKKDESTKTRFSPQSFLSHVKHDAKSKLKNIEDEAENLIAPNGEKRLKRSVASSNSRPVDLNAPANLQDPNLHLIVHWAGQNSSNLVLLTKNVSYNSLVTSSNVYFSYNYGKNYTRKIKSPDQKSSSPNDDRHMKFAYINSFYSSKSDVLRYIFTDVQNRTLYTTTDAGKTIRKSHRLSFSPDLISIHLTKPWIVLALDKTSPNKALYKSDDFGQSWRQIQLNVKTFDWGYPGRIHYDKEDALYVQRLEPDGEVTVLRTETYFQQDTVDHVLITNVEDFFVMNQSMFATRKALAGTAKDLWIARTRKSRFSRANFHLASTVVPKEYFVVDAADSQIMVCVNMNHETGSITHLYISEPNEIDFTLSLENVTYFNPDSSFSPLSLYTSERFADVFKVHGMRSIYIANVRNNSQQQTGIFQYDLAEDMHSVITFNKGGFWERIPAPTYDANGDRINCTARSGCSLHLTQAFHRAYPLTSTNTIYSRSSAPGFVLAQGNVGKTIKQDPDLYFSSTAGQDWTQVLSGVWRYTWGDHGGIIVAVLKFESVDTLWYSLNQGEQWDTFKFSDESIRVYGLMTEPGETSSVFTIFGSSNKGSHSWLLIQVNFTKVFSGPCTDDDYKDWSPADERSVTCLLGSQSIFKRRIKHSICFNGRNYDRPTSTKSCPCTRDDFECDIGYSTLTFGYLCYPNPNATSTIGQVPPTCYTGGYYNRTKGYRRLAGDLCSGGSAESHYAPDRVPCPTVEENAFMLQSTSYGLYRIDLETNGTTNINPNIVSSKDLDFDYKTNTLFWINGSALMQTNLNTSDSKWLFKHTRYILHLSLDWLTSNVYWTDSQGGLYITNLNGATRKLGVNCSVADVVVVPDKARIYYICAGSSNSLAYEALTDGSNSSIIFAFYSTGYSISSLRNRISLTFDPTSDRLYWLYNGQLGSFHRDGSNHTTLYSGSNLGYSYGHLSVFKKDIYWLTRTSSYGRDYVYSIDKYQYTSSAHRFRRGPAWWRRPTSMQIFTRQAQSTVVSNSCATKKCSQLCVLEPSTQHPSRLDAKCLCGHSKDLEIHYGPSGNEMCVCPSGQIFNQTAKYCQTTNKTCAPNQFLCSNNQCILNLWRCDGEDDCKDQSDEIDCPNQNCKDFQFECANSGRCISTNWVCDFDNDCGDGSDERNCTYPTCDPNTQFTCSNGRCKNINWVCDGDNDCGDWSDEKNCNNTRNTTCNSVYQFYCAIPTASWVGNCLPRTWVCDGAQDCSDGSDEANCNSTSRTCEAFKRPCSTGGACIFNWWWCDGTSDCDDSSDEFNCPTTTPRPTTTTTPLPANHNCTGTDLKCRHTGACYPQIWQCDGVNDCGDYSDEFDCSNSNTTTSPTTLPCFSNYLQFRCANGRCIFSFFQCDQDNDCGDWSDERDCPNFPKQDDGCIVGYGTDYQGTRSYTKTGRTCQRWDSNTPHVPHYRPQNPHHNYCRDPDNDNTGPWCYTTDPQKRWDYCGIPHCDSHSASPVPPTAGPFHCGVGFLDCGPGVVTRCVYQNYSCDGYDDCENGADEENCVFNCSSNEFQCKNGRCIANSLRCDYNDDCYDNSDEVNCTTHVHCNSFNVFRCSDSTCIPGWKQCDGNKDCSDGSDELPQYCDTTTKATSQFKCNSNNVYINVNQRCDFKPDCNDMSDEAFCHNYGPVSTSRCPTRPNGRNTTCEHFSISNPPSRTPTGYAIHYRVMDAQALTVNNSFLRVIKWNPSNSFNLPNLLNNQQYRYAIALKYSNYTLPLGSVREFTTPQTRPAPPNITSANQYQQNSIDVKWSTSAHSNTYITGYLVSVNPIRSFIAPIQKTTYSTFGTIVTGVPAGRYYVQIKAQSALGNSDWSNRVNVTVDADRSAIPARPVVSNITRSTALIEFTPLSTPNLNYSLVVESVGSDYYQEEVTLNDKLRAVTVHQLEPGKTFRTRVIPIYSDHTGAVSLWTQFSTLTPRVSHPVISQKKSHAINSTSIMLVWSAVTDKLITQNNGVTYRVEYGESYVNREHHLHVRNKTSFVVTRLPLNTLQFFRVAVLEPFVGQWSNYVSLSPVPDYSGAPLRLTVDVHKPWTSARVCWESSVSQYGRVEPYQITLQEYGKTRNTFSKQITPTARDANYANDPIVCYTLTVTPPRVYVVTIRDVVNGKLGNPANHTFFAGGTIPPIQTIKVINIPGRNDYELSFVVLGQDIPYYNNVLRGVRVLVCPGKNVVDPPQHKCTNYGEISSPGRSTILGNLPAGWYTVFLSLECSSKQVCAAKPFPFHFQASATAVPTASPSSKGLGRTSVIAIAVSSVVVVLCLIFIILYLVRRNRRLAHSYSQFVSSHYDPQRGEAFFVDDRDAFDNGLDDEPDAETPMISGFADDEPLIVA